MTTPTPEAITRRLLKTGTHARIAIIATDRDFFAKAYPNRFHPALAAAAHDGSVTLTQASEINHRANSTPIATTRGATILDALEALESVIRRQEHAA
jgi:hypothetical protein